MRVAVVGAGFAGLAAAELLARNGVEVVVLEARDRVGGRVWSRRLENGAWSRWARSSSSPAPTRSTTSSRGSGSSFWDKGMFYGEREPRGGIGVDAVQLHAATEAIAAALSERPRGALGVSARTFLDGLDLDPGAQEAIEARLEISCVSTVDRIDAGVLGGLAAHSHDACPSLAGGNQSLALALAERLGPAVQLRTAVTRVSWRDGGATISAAGSELDVDRVVLAMPASVLGRVVFEPALPPSLSEAYAAVEMGNAAKLFVPLLQDGRALGGDGGRRALLDLDRDRGRGSPAGRPCVRGLGPGARAPPRRGGRRDLARLGDPAAARARARSRMRSSSRPGLTIRGWRPRTRPPCLRWRRGLLSGPFHACGEHTAGEVHALMEGALRSGVRAAREILDG